jgi:hypothetical protein
MAKEVKPLTREERIALVEKTLAPMETDTKVKAWTFSVEKQHYVLLSFVSNRISYIEAYPSTRAGRKTDNKPVVSFPGSTDYMKGFTAAVEKLIPLEDEVIS